ncbi:MAG: hypothetical protein HRT99_04365, partial [Mycoplasmatales bacterium]|nr:hypothetical protein [Mycoplasmatales bacterium]
MSSSDKNNNELIKLINDGIISINFYVTNKDGSKVKFEGQISSKNNNNLSVGDKIQGFYEITNKYSKTYAISNNPNDKNNKISFNDVSGLMVHPSVLGDDSNDDALEKILNASIETKTNASGDEIIKVIISSKNNQTTIVPNNEHWHWEYGTSDSTNNAPITWMPVTSLDKNKTNFIDDLLKNRNINNTKIYVRLKADPNYILDNPSYHYWSSNVENLKNVIDISSLGNLKLEITGINGKADVNSIVENPSTGTLSKFKPPTNTHLVYAVLSENKTLTDKDIQNINKWTANPKELNIKVGDYVVALLKPNNSKTVISGLYYTKNPILATNLTIDFEKIKGLQIFVKGKINKYGKLGINLGESDEIQTNGIIWKASINSGNPIDIKSIENLANNDKVMLKIEAKSGYKLPDESKYLNKLPSIVVKGLKDPIFINPGIRISINDQDIYGLSENNETVNLTDESKVIVNGKAFIKNTTLMSYNNGSYNTNTSIEKINNGINSIIVDSKKNQIKGIILTIFFQLNGGEKSENFPSGLKNGDIITASVGISPKTPSNLMDKYIMADEEINTSYRNIKTTYTIHGLAVKAPDLGEISIEVPNNSDGNGTIIIKTEKPIPSGYAWSYQIRHKNGKTEKWSQEIPDNLVNGDVVDYKLINTNNIPLLNNYKGSKLISGLIKSKLVDNGIEEIINDLYQKMSFIDDNGSGQFADKTKDLILKVNKELEKLYPEYNARLSFDLIDNFTNGNSIIEIDTHSLSNKDKIVIKISNSNLQLRSKYIKTVNGLKESDVSIDKSLIWGITIGVISVFILSI